MHSSVRLLPLALPPWLLGAPWCGWVVPARRNGNRELDYQAAPRKDAKVGASQVTNVANEESLRAMSA